MTIVNPRIITLILVINVTCAVYVRRAHSCERTPTTSRTVCTVRRTGVHVKSARVSSTKNDFELMMSKT